MKRLKDTQIDKMDGCRNMFQKGSSVQHPICCGQDVLDIQNRVSYTDSHKKEVLINHVTLEDIYYIGDTTGDIKEGRQAGVKTVGVTWGWHSKELMAASRPDHLFDQPEDLLQLN